MTDLRKDQMGTPKIADRATFQAQLDALRFRGKAHTHEGDAIAAAVVGCPWWRWTPPSN